jgi:hypothetical protein
MGVNKPMGAIIVVAHEKDNANIASGSDPLNR